MRRSHHLLCGGLLLAALGVAGCGDNSASCGDGTMNDHGVCVPSGTCGAGTVADPTTGACIPDGSVICTDGTRFDPASGTCMIDPDSCQNGTVLVGDRCVDPTADLTIDLEEGPEPNGEDIIEASATPAGEIAALEPVGGDSYVIHGHITPFQDTDGDGQLDPDVDSYVLQVSGPTLIHMTADGVHGIDAGFVAIAAVTDQHDPLAGWIRFGLDITGDTSKRQVFLPAAGTYFLAIADTRTLFEYATGGPTRAAPGDANGAYYVSIETLDLPTPTALTVTDGVATRTGTISSDEVQFYSVDLGTGINDATLETTAPQITASLVASVDDDLRSIGDASAGLPAASVAFGGVSAGATTVLVVDDQVDTATAPVDFTLTVDTRDAAALSTTGGTATQPETVNTGDRPLAVNQFYYDVTAADQLLGMNLHWNVPVDGLIVDQDFYLFATFTYDPNSGFVGDTFQDFNGLLRHAAPGRYYFLVYDPAGAAGTDSLTATSTISPVTPGAVTLGAATASQPVSAYGQDAFTFDSTTSEWDSFGATGTGTGDLEVAFYDPSTAYGRLGNLDYTSHDGFDETYGPEAAAAFTKSLDASGEPQGEILLSQPTHTFFGTVTTENATGSYVLDFAHRAYHDFGAMALGQEATVTGESLAAAPANYYLVESDAGNAFEIAVAPQAEVDPSISLLADDESVIGTVDAGGFGEAELGHAVFGGSPAYLAWKVGGVVLTPSATYDVTATVPPP
jgi:hypothetical protein